MSSSAGPNSTQQFGVIGPLDIPLGIGLLRLTTEDRPDDLNATAVLRFALNQGVRLFDVADSYCQSDDDFHYGETSASPRAIQTR